MRLPLFLFAGFLTLTGLTLSEVPRLLQHQGRMAVNGMPFDGTGLFKLALVNADGTQTYWSNDGTSTAGSQPAAAVSLTVVKGLYSVLLGDAGVANMTALPDSVFEYDDVRLRIWFNDGVKGFQQITPDQRLVSTPFALRAAKASTVDDASITSDKLAANLTLAGTTTGTFVGDGSGLTGISSSSSALLENLQAHPAKPVICWGGNDHGQTSVPASVTGANTSAIAAGGETSLALLKNGTLVQWGAGAAVPSGLSNVTRIAVGASHRLARKNDGSITAWGDDSYGQATVPGGLANAIDVAAGEKHSLALLSNGTVAAWGDNTFGQTTVPAGTTNVIAIAAGADHNLALKADGSIVAWGRDETGQSTPPPGLAGVVAIACGAYHSLAVKNDGSVVAWGWDIGGQCAVPAGLDQVTKVAAGYAFSLALRSDGTLVAWGDNTDLQLDPPAAAADVTAIACGLSHAIALRDDLVPAQVARLDQDNVMNGSLGVKRSPTANTLEVEGSASKTTAGNWLANSDRRIKTDIRPVENALETLDRVRLVGFHYTDDYLRAHPGLEDRTYLNVIAQEFAEVFPEHVRSSGEKLADGSEILQVDTYPLTIYSAAAVQELRRENQELRRQMQAQEERLRRIEAAISQ